MVPEQSRSLLQLLQRHAFHYREKAACNVATLYCMTKQDVFTYVCSECYLDVSYVPDLDYRFCIGCEDNVVVLRLNLK